MAEAKEDGTEIYPFAFKLQETRGRLRRREKDPRLLVLTMILILINHFFRFILASWSKTNVVLRRGNSEVKLLDIRGNLHEVTLLYYPPYQQNIFQSTEVDNGGGINLQVESLKLQGTVTYNIYLNPISSLI